MRRYSTFIKYLLLPFVAIQLINFVRLTQFLEEVKPQIISNVSKQQIVSETSASPKGFIHLPKSDFNDSNRTKLSDVRWKWTNISGMSMFDFDLFHNYELVWSPSAVKMTQKDYNNAIAVAATKMNLNYVKVIILQIEKIRRVSDHDIVIIVLQSGTTPEVVTKLRARIVDKKFNGVEVFETKLGFEKSELSKTFINYLNTNPSCCGIAEYVKLEAFGLSYDKVLFLDLDATLMKSPDILFQSDADFLYTAGPQSPLNGGFFLVKPSLGLYSHVISTLKDVSNRYTNELCYEGLGCGPCLCPKCATLVSDRQCTGSEGPQGFLHYYFVKRQDPNLKVHQIDSCFFNFQAKGKGIMFNGEPIICNKDNVYNTYPYNIHKDKHGMLSNLKEKMIITPTKKMCRPDFWILGTRKGGTTGLYTLLAQNPRIASLHITGGPRDGEASGSVSAGNYNEKFIDAPNGSLVGDSTVGRIVSDAHDIVKTCGHKYTKFLILLRNPIERCYSQMMMRARLGTDNMNKNSNISKFILNDLRKFQKKTSYSTNWTMPMYPPNIIGKLNCIYAGVYVVQLKRWLYHASVTNIRIYFTEDFLVHTEEIVLDALQFIGVSREEMMNFTLNISKGNANNRPKEDIPPHQQLTPALRRELEETFAPYNIMLKELLNVDLPWK